MELWSQYRKRKFVIVKRLLIAWIVAFFAITCVELLVRRDELYEHIHDDIDEQFTQQMLTVSMAVAFVILLVWTGVYLLLIVRESFVGVLVMVILAALSLVYSFTRIGEKMAPTVVDLVFTTVEILLGIAYALLIRAKARRYNSHHTSGGDDFA